MNTSQIIGVIVIAMAVSVLIGMLRNRIADRARMADRIASMARYRARS